MILCTCDRPHLIGRALTSALQQSGVDFEVVLVDSNRRTDPVRKNILIRSLLDDERVRVVEPDPPVFSVASARNAGLAAARGDWIAYLDDDDEFLPDRLAGQLSLAQERNASLVICGYTFVWPSGRRRTRQCQQSEFRGDELLFDAQLISAVLFHRSDPAWRFDESLFSGEDRVAVISYFIRHNLWDVPCLPRPGSLIHSQKISAHKNRDLAWSGCLAGLRWARRAKFSRIARRKFLLSGSIERAVAGHGSLLRFFCLLMEWLKMDGWKGHRFVVFAIINRFFG